MGKPEQPIYRFSLSTRDEHFDDLKTICDWLKGQGDLSEFIRESIRLRADLLRGSTAVLDEQFPFVKRPVETPSPASSGGSDEMLTLLKTIDKKLDRREQQQGGDILDIRQNGFPAFAPAPKGLPAAPVAAVTVAKAASAEEICDNFMAFLQ